jgi:hypothetical protein
MEANKYRELKRRLELVEAVYRRPGSDGEKQAAALAIQRLRQRLQVFERYEQIQIRKPTYVIFEKV